MTSVEFHGMYSVLDRSSTIGVVGSGTMGTGIAQVAAMHGHRVVLFDNSSDSLVRAQAQLSKIFARLAEKGAYTSQEAEEVKRRIVLGQNLRAFAHCKLIVEAIVEDLAEKQDLFTQLEPIIPETCVLATNTSSLSVALIAGPCQHPGRVLGLHFFNPAALMELVEVIPWPGTTEESLVSVENLVRGWGKRIVRAADTPGFIVNRVARPYYLESLRIAEDGIADYATIDWALKEFGAFKMGPFELMDLIGLDVNLKVSESVFQAFYNDPRFRPSLLQRRLVEAGHLGKKSGKGFYDHGLQSVRPQPNTDAALGKEIFERVLCCLINEACQAVLHKVASKEDVELAVTLGLNYPRGLLKWCDEIGAAKVLTKLEALCAEYGRERYRPSALLKTHACSGKSFFEN